MSEFVVLPLNLDRMLASSLLILFFSASLDLPGIQKLNQKEINRTLK